MVDADSPLTPRPPSNLPADFHKPLSHSSSQDGSSSSASPSYQANHPYMSHLLFPSHWRHLPQLSAGAGPFTTKLVHQTPSGHKVNWESRRHRKKLQQRVDAPNAPPTAAQHSHSSGADTPSTGQQPQPSKPSLYQRMFPFKPDRIPWWTAVLFDVGSLCFVFSSICEFIPHIYDSLHLDTGYVGWTSFAGSVCFTVGAFLQFGEVLSAPIVAIYHAMSRQERRYMTLRAYKGRPKHKPQIDPQQQQQADGAGGQASNGDEESQPSVARANLSSLLYRLDFHVAWIQLIGTIAFNINTFAFSGSFQLTTSEETGLVDFCDIFASCCFTISGYLSILEVTHTIVPFKALPITRSLGSIEWWLTWFNFLGGVGFLLNGIFIVDYPDPGQLQPAYPLLIGSVFFQMGSHLQYLEQADTHGNGNSQQQPQAQRQQPQKMDGQKEDVPAEHQQTAQSRLEQGVGGSEDGHGAMNGQYADGAR